MKNYKRLYEEYLMRLGEPYEDAPEPFKTPYGIWQPDFYSAYFDSYIRLGARDTRDNELLKWILSHAEEPLELVYVSYEHIEKLALDMWQDRLRADDEKKETDVRRMLHAVEAPEPPTAPPIIEKHPEE